MEQPAIAFNIVITHRINTKPISPAYLVQIPEHVKQVLATVRKDWFIVVRSKLASCFRRLEELQLVTRVFGFAKFRNRQAVAEAKAPLAPLSDFFSASSSSV